MTESYKFTCRLSFDLGGPALEHGSSAPSRRLPPQPIHSPDLHPGGGREFRVHEGIRGVTTELNASGGGPD